MLVVAHTTAIKLNNVTHSGNIVLVGLFVLKHMTLTHGEEHVKTLVTLGLSYRQAKICLALSVEGTSTVKEITEASNIARPDTYRTLLELEKKGLIEKIISNPMKYKLLPLPMVISMLLGQKEAESIRLQENSAALLKEYNEVDDKEKVESNEFVVIPSGKALTKKIDHLIEHSQENICIFANQRQLSSFFDSFRMINNTFDKIQIRIITNKGRNDHRELQTLRKKTGLEIRFTDILPTFSLATFDNKEVLLFMNDLREDHHAFATYSNNSSLVELSQSYFDSAWFSAMEPPNMAFKRTQLQFDYLFTNMLTGFAYCKMIYKNGKPTDFVFVQVNEEFERITSCKNSQIIGKRVTKLFPEIKEQPEIFEIFGRIITSGKAEKFELFFKPLNIWLYLSVYTPVKGYFALIFEDITEQKHQPNTQSNLPRKQETSKHKSKPREFRTHILSEGSMT